MIGPGQLFASVTETVTICEEANSCITVVPLPIPAHCTCRPPLPPEGVAESTTGAFTQTVSGMIALSEMLGGVPIEIGTCTVHPLESVIETVCDPAARSLACCCVPPFGH